MGCGGSSTAREATPLNVAPDSTQSQAPAEAKDSEPDVKPASIAAICPEPDVKPDAKPARFGTCPDPEPDVKPDVKPARFGTCPDPDPDVKPDVKPASFGTCPEPDVKPASIAGGGSVDAQSQSQSDAVGADGVKLDSSSKVKNVKQGSIDKEYTVARRPLARGGYGTVFTAVEKATNRTRAVKQISKEKMNVEQLTEEIEISKSMDHPNVVRLVASYQDSHYVQLVMELCEGGELFEFICAERKLGEQKVAKIMEQILRSVAYVHGKGIAHCDIKPENFLYATNEPIENNTLKLVDFGLSKHVKGDERLHAMAGSAYYVAPEVLNKNYGQECDVWSCGVIMYLMLCGQPPFSGMSDPQIHQKIKKGEYRLCGRLWEPVCEPAKELIRKMLAMEPSSRLTAEEVFQSGWIQDAVAAADSDDNLLAEQLQSLKSFASVSRFKRVSHVLLAQAKDHNMVDLKRCFLALDKDGNGMLSMQEMKDAFSSVSGIDEAELTRLFEAIDSNGDEKIEYGEFLSFCMMQQLDNSEQAAWVAFKAFDLNGNGFVSLQEIREVLEQNNVPISSCESLDQYQKCMNQKGEVDFAGFREMLQEDYASLIARVSSTLALHAEM